MTEADNLPEEKLPESGYRIQRIYSLKQSYEVVDAERLADPESGQITLHWDWLLLEPSGETQRFEIRLRVTVEGTKERPDVASVDLVGRFQQVGDQQSIELEPFVITAGPAILLPYVRERISSLTSHGPYDSYFFPISNVLNLMKKMDYSLSSGAKQLAERSESANARAEPRSSGPAEG